MRIAQALFLCPKRNRNLAQNPGFETAGAGGADAFASWTEEVAGTSTVTRDTAEYDTGAASCKLTIDATNGAASVKQEILVVGRRYKAMLRAKASAACTIKLVAPETSWTLTTAWATYSVTFTASDANFKIANNSAASKTVYLDSVTCRRV